MLSTSWAGKYPPPVLIPEIFESQTNLFYLQKFQYNCRKSFDNTGKEKPPEAVPLPGRGTPLETFYYPPPATTNADPATNNFSTDLKFTFFPSIH